MRSQTCSCADFKIRNCFGFLDMLNRKWPTSWITLMWAGNLHTVALGRSHFSITAQLITKILTVLQRYIEVLHFLFAIYYGFCSSVLRQQLTRPSLGSLAPSQCTRIVSWGLQKREISSKPMDADAPKGRCCYCWIKNFCFSSSCFCWNCCFSDAVFWRCW